MASARDTNAANSIGPTRQLEAFIGRYCEKDFDWDAFPSSRGYPELDRAQMRYIGGGGSPKVDDPATLVPGEFTLSLVHQPVGKYAPSHSHECVEHFMVLSGALTVGWVYGDEVFEAKLGPGDLVLNKPGRAHGFRNDGPDPALMTITVGSGKPRPPVYAYHPEGKDPARARMFGAAPGKTFPLRLNSGDWRQEEFASHLMRRRNLHRIECGSGIGRYPYIGEGGAKPGAYRMELIQVPPRARVRAYTRGVEDVYFVLKGHLTAGWEKQGVTEEQILGAKDLIFNPPNTARFFRNDGTEMVEFLLLVGSPTPESVQFESSGAS